MCLLDDQYVIYKICCDFGTSVTKASILLLLLMLTIYVHLVIHMRYNLLTKFSLLTNHVTKSLKNGYLKIKVVLATYYKFGWGILFHVKLNSLGLRIQNQKIKK